MSTEEEELQVSDVTSFLTRLVSLTPAGSRGGGDEQRRSAPRGAKDVAFPSEHLQPPGVHTGCSPVPVEHQTLHHMSGTVGAAEPQGTDANVLI